LFFLDVALQGDVERLFYLELFTKLKGRGENLSPDMLREVDMHKDSQQAVVEVHSCSLQPHVADWNDNNDITDTGQVGG
jgi:hypothetical protein